MKKKKMMSLTALSLALLFACGNTSSDVITGGDSSGSGEASTPKPVEDGKGELVGEGFNLKFAPNSDASGIYASFYVDGKDTPAFIGKEPCVVNIRTKSSGIIETFTESIVSSSYKSLSKDGSGSYYLYGTVTSRNGSEYSIEDQYSLKDGAIVIKRNIEVTKASENDAGYSTTIKFNDNNPVSSSEYDYFIPSIIYKDTQDMVNGAIFSNTDLVGRNYVKETRTGLPLMYTRNITNNYAFTLAHVDNTVSSGDLVGGGAAGEINNDIKYGSIGMTMGADISVDYTYPCSEGPTTYDAGASWAKRYHENKVGNKDEFTVGAYLEGTTSYQDSMVNSYEKMYGLMNSSTADMNISQIYEDNLEIFKSEYKEYGSGDEKYAGEPWSITLPDGTKNQGYSSQMGFVGQQIPVGYQLYRYGLMNNDEETKHKGKTILNFWSSDRINSAYFPYVWWDPADSASLGSNRGYPCFLRCMVDGMEGMLDAYIISKQYNEENSQYLSAVTKFAQNLVKAQNEDGSFYRAYNIDGTVNTDTSNSAFQGSSKLNTPVAVRFLVKMYELTSNENYRLSALKAGEYCYTELYQNLGKYVGGTPDNPNTVDKEAAVYAMYCFTSLYQLTKEDKYLKAARHAAISSLSWVYIYDFKVPSSESKANINTFKDGGVKGFSMIATGHSGADNYAAYIYYELFNLYVLTGETFYKDTSYFIQNNTKLSNDYDGRMGFAYKALMPEATTVSDFDFKSVGTWLPWSSIANVEPIVNMEKTYGNNDVSKITDDIDTLKTKLESYGVGGNIS